MLSAATRRIFGVERRRTRPCLPRRHAWEGAVAAPERCANPSIMTWSVSLHPQPSKIERDIEKVEAKRMRFLTGVTGD